MADYSQNLTNAVRCFGGGGASLWNAYNWNAFNWGEGTVTIPHDVMHIFGVSVTPASAYSSKAVFHALDAQTVSPTVDFSKSPLLYVLGTVTTTAETVTENLGDGSGWNYIFRSDTTDADDRSTAVWTTSADPTSSWTSSTDTTTVWS